MTVRLVFARADHGPDDWLLQCDCGASWVGDVLTWACPWCEARRAVFAAAGDAWRPEDEAPSGWLSCPTCGWWIRALDVKAGSPVHGSCCGVHGPVRTCNGRLLEVSRGTYERGRTAWLHATRRTATG